MKLTKLFILLLIISSCTKDDEVITNDPIEVKEKVELYKVISATDCDFDNQTVYNNHCISESTYIELTVQFTNAIPEDGGKVCDEFTFTDIDGNSFTTIISSVYSYNDYSCD